MSSRFFADPPVESDHYALGGEQAHHVSNVMRLTAGDQLVLFDGSGYEFLAKIISINKRQVELEIVKKSQISLELGRPITIAVSLPKGDRQKFLVEKLVELGCAELIPLKTSRSVADANPKVIERIKRQVVEASKQCGRNHLMAVAEQHSINELLGRFRNSPDRRILADPYAKSSVADGDSSLGAIVAVGPEGGFSDEEGQLFEQDHWVPGRLGLAVLRIETAAIAALSVLGLQSSQSGGMS